MLAPAAGQVGGFAERNARVWNSLLRFQAIDYTDPRLAGPLEQRQRLLLRSVASENADGLSAGAGAAIFAVMTVFTAHAPQILHGLFTGPVRLGPAVLPDGGMGAGISGRW